MDNLCLKSGIHGTIPPANGVTQKRGTGSTLSMKNPSSSALKNNLAYGFLFPYPLRSVWPNGRKYRHDAVGADDAVLAEENDDDQENVTAQKLVSREESRGGGGGEEQKDEEELEGGHGNWVMKILHVRSLGKQENGEGVKLEDQNDVSDNNEEIEKGCCGEDEECGGCCIGDDDDGDERTEFDQESFSRLLKRVSLAEARLYAQLCYLGSLAYDISQIKPKNHLRYHRLRFVTSSFEKKEQAVNAEREKTLAEGNQPGKENITAEAAELKDSKLEQADKDKKTEGEKLSRSAAYEVAASAASYLHSCTQSINPFRTSKSTKEEDLSVCDKLNITHEHVASFMATTESVTSVVAAKEEVKQAVADDLNSICLSTCEWFICDDDRSATRYFVIQGSDSLASWKANLLFEPIRFEGLNVLVHRGIYEAAKGMYEQLLPEVHHHLKAHGSRAKFRFTGHSLGGSLSLLVNLMLLIRGEVPISSLLPVITFGSPAVMCGGDQLLYQLGLSRSHVQSIAMHRDIVPRAFSCNYPHHVAKILKAVNGNFRNHPCLNNQALLYAPMGEFLILQPSEKYSPHHHLLPSGSGLYLLTSSVPDSNEVDQHFRAALSVFLNSPHPLEILSDRSAYGSSGSIYRDHDMNSYLKSIRNVIRQELNRIRRERKERRRKVRCPTEELHEANGSVTAGRPVVLGNMNSRFSFSGIIHNGRESLKRFSRLVASQHTHLLVVLLLPTRLLILGTYNIINIY